MPSDQIDRKIDEALKLVVETLNIDRSIFHEFSEERGLLKITHFFIIFYYEYFLSHRTHLPLWSEPIGIF